MVKKSFGFIESLGIISYATYNSNKCVNFMKLQNAQKLCNQGYPPEMALRLVGANWVPGVDYVHRNFAHDGAEAIFAKDDFTWGKAKSFPQIPLVPTRQIATGW